MRARPGVRIFSGFLFFVTRAFSLSQDAMRESSGQFYCASAAGGMYPVAMRALPMSMTESSRGM